jgi:poly(hydroxyalkanoate) granule-associated protein
MVKKMKSAAPEAKSGNQLAAAIKDSASQIWLAGLGAFAKAQEEGGKVFEALVQEGSTIQSRTKAFTEDKLGNVTDKVTKAAGDVAKQATHSWDKLESVFEERVARALSRLGVPTKKDVQALSERVEQLNSSVQTLGGKPLAGKKPRAKAATRVATKVATKRKAKKV